MRYDLTLAKIRNTDFASLYDRFIIGEKLSQKQYEILLAIAICFTNADDTEYSCAVKPPFRDAGYRRSRDGVPQIV